MFIPKLLPEELLDGYRGRLRLLNGLRDGKAVVEEWNGLILGVAGHQRCAVAFTDLVAGHNGCSSYNVVMRHSLWPFTSAVDRPVDVQAVEALVKTQSGRTAVMRGARSHAWLCLNCVKEDLGFWHVSYWRRAHQLPGALWCDKHLSTLGRVSSGAIQAGPPDHCIEDAAFPEAGFVENLQGVAEVQRFLDICNGILESGPLLERATCASVLVRQAVEAGICSKPEGASAALTELVRQRLPVAWCREVFPKVEWDRSGTASTIDVVCRNQPYGASTTSVAFVAGLLFRSSDEALRVLAGGDRSRRCGSGGLLPDQARGLQERTGQSP
jgi:hypothetical protein